MKVVKIATRSPVRGVESDVGFWQGMEIGRESRSVEADGIVNNVTNNSQRKQVTGKIVVC